MEVAAVTHYVYLLRCADSSVYVGEASNLQARERDHNEGRGGSHTAKRCPLLATSHGCQAPANEHESDRLFVDRL